MSVLRRNKDSLMAVLEAFVYDPLLNWRLIEGGAVAAGVGKSVVDVGGGVAGRSKVSLSDATPTVSLTSGGTSDSTSSINTLSEMANNNNSLKISSSKKQPQTTENFGMYAHARARTHMCIIYVVGFNSTNDNLKM